VSLAGYLYVLGAPLVAESKEDISPSLFTLDVTQQTGPQLVSTAYDNTTGNRFGYMLAENDAAVLDADRITLFRIDYENDEVALIHEPGLWNESHPVSSGASGWVAYAGQETNFQPSDGQQFIDLDNWQIILVQPETGDIRTISGAAQPVWMNDGADLLYLKHDGVYRYNLAADASELVIDDFANIANDTQLAINDSSTYVLLTVPQPDFSFIMVYDVVDQANVELRRIGAIAQEGVRYVDPVFAPGGNQYAVLAIQGGVFNTTLENYSDVTLEIRNTIDRTVLESQPLTFDSRAPLRLFDWRAAREPFIAF